MTENIITGKFYRILTDSVNMIWDRLSFWKKSSDVEFEDGTNLENNKPISILKRSTAYTVGTIVYISAAPSWVQLKCTTAGTTASTQPGTYASISAAGTTITDGTAKFTVYDIRPSATLSSSAYQVPTMNLVNNIDSQLTANGRKFYFAYENGQYGYKAGSSGTFTPF